MRLEARKVLPEFWPDDIRNEIGSIPVYVVPREMLLGKQELERAMIAFVNRRTQSIYLIADHIEDMTDDALKVVILHEVFHLKQPLATEKECDEYARNIIGIPAYIEAVQFTRNLEAKLRQAAYKSGGLS